MKGEYCVDGGVGLTADVSLTNDAPNSRYPTTGTRRRLGGSDRGMW